MIYSPAEMQEHAAAQMRALQRAAAALRQRHAGLYRAMQQAQAAGDDAEVMRLKLEMAQVERDIDGLFVGRML